jgi:hypothetical protein
MNTLNDFVSRWNAMLSEVGDTTPAKFFRLPTGDFPFLRADELQLLREVGLPDGGSSFSYEDVEDGIPRVDEVYGPNDEELWQRIGRDSVARFRMLGQDGGGNPLVLNLETHEIHLLDHESDFQPYGLAGSSLAQFMECLLVFTRVESSAPDVDVAALQAQLRAIDPQLAERNGYWFSTATDLPDFT